MTTQVTERNSGQTDPRHGLFRQQAVYKQQDRLLGEVLVIPPVSYSLLTAILILFVCAATVLLVNGTYARKVTVQGVLVPDTGVIKIYASRNGIARNIFVKEGDKVVKDQPLMMINGDQILESGEHLEAVLLEEYLSQQRTLSEQLNRLDNVFANKLTTLTQQEAALKKDIQHLVRQQNFTNEQLALAEHQLADIKALVAKGLSSEFDADSAREKVISLKNQRQSVARSLDSQQASLTSNRLQQDALGFEQQEQRDRLHASLSSLVQSITQLHGQRAHILKANSAGIVSSIQIQEGQIAPTSIPLMTITPADSSLQAELLVPARAIGFVEVDQPLKIRYSAFNFQKFGLHDATITEVSQTVLLPEELTGLSIGAQESMYRVTATLDQQTISAYGKSFPLKHGIALEADINLAERRLMEWLLEPVLSLKGRL